MKLNCISIRKTIIYMCVAAILSVLAMFNFSVANYAKNEKYIELRLDKGDIVKDIVISSNSLNLANYQNEKIKLNNLINETNEKSELCINENTNLYIKVSEIDNVNINIISADNSLIYNINNKEFIVNGENISIYPLKSEILKNSININSVWIFLVSYIVILMCVYSINYILNKIKNNELGVIYIVLLIISIFIIYLSNIYLLMMLNKLLAILPAVILSIYLLWYFKFSIKNWENVFLIITSVIGTMMLFIITPGNVPDEPSHYVRSYADSVTFSKEEKDNLRLPNDVNSFFDKFTHNVHSLDIKYSGNSYMTELMKDTDYNRLCDFKVDYSNTKNLSFLPYIPSTLVNFIGRSIRLPILLNFLICRLADFIISTLLCYFAIKSTPKFKKIFAILAIFPIFLQQSIGINMDYLTNAITFLFIAIIFKYKFENVKVTVKNLSLLLGLGILLGLCKFGYFPLLLLILLIPKEKFKDKKTSILFKILILTVPLIVSYLANFTAVTNPNESTEKYTISTVLANPLNSAKICLKTFFLRFEADTFSGLIDGFGWSTKYQLELSLWTFAAIVILILFTDNTDSKFLNLKDRSILIIVWGIVYLILYGVAFTEWTSKSLDTINGLQARYFIPILPLFYIAISNSFLNLNVKDKWKFYTILLFIAELLSTMSILIAFY